MGGGGGLITEILRYVNRGAGYGLFELSNSFYSQCCQLIGCYGEDTLGVRDWPHFTAHCCPDMATVGRFLFITSEVNVWNVC